MVADGDTVAVRRDVPVVTVDDTDGVMVGDSEGVTVTVLEPTVPA